MKPFDLELAKAKHPVQTRDGRPVRILCYDKKDDDYPIVALIEEVNCDTEVIEDYTIGGKFDVHILRSDNDLVMATTKKEGWINLYHSSIYVAGVSNVYETEEETLKGKDEEGYILTKKIEWEE